MNVSYDSMGDQWSEHRWLIINGFEQPQLPFTFVYCIATHHPRGELGIWIYLPFWPNKVMRDLHCWEWQQSLTHGHTNIIHVLDTQGCFRVPPANMLCTVLEWPADNAEILNITFLTLLSSVKLSWLCLTIEGSKSLETLFTSVSCKILGQCLLSRCTDNKEIKKD
jgi:hypothetical protein